MRRMESAAVNKLIEPPAAEGAAATSNGTAAAIAIDDFAKLDLRVAVVVTAEEVDGADKLLRLTVDLGDGRHRQVFAGIKNIMPPPICWGGRCFIWQISNRAKCALANLKG